MGTFQGRRPELVGGGLDRSLGGWSEVLALRSRGEKPRSDQRILGDSEFVHDVIFLTIKSQFDFPEKDAPVYVISNDGNIPIVSLRINHNMYIFDKRINGIKYAALNSNLFGDYWVFIKVFEPTKYEYYKLLRLYPAKRN